MEAASTKSVCVTGAGGFIASWLVKLLLSKGHYTVRGTVRDPGDAKNAHLKALEGAEERLQLVKADLLDYDSVASATAGCEGVFHVACPVPSGRSTNPEAEIIAPAVTGTLNVLKACYEANVKRVIMVSSGAAVVANPSWPEGKAFDEESWSDEDHCRKNGVSKATPTPLALPLSRRSSWRPGGANPSRRHPVRPPPSLPPRRPSRCCRPKAAAPVKGGGDLALGCGPRRQAQPHGGRWPGWACRG